MTNHPSLLVVPSADEVSASAAALVVEGLAAAIEARGVAHWSTTGGSAAPGIYRSLCAAPLRDALDWSHVHVWWGDDRFVAAGDPLSNVTAFEQVFRAPGTGIWLPDSHVHPIRMAEALAAGWGPAKAAAAYEREIRGAGPLPDDNGVPSLDVLVVGVGPDGHLLSVFPGSAVWDLSVLVAGVPAPTHVEPHVPRVTMHPRVLASARSVLVVAAGGGKAEVLAQAWTGDDVRELPVRAAMGPNATWVLDAAAAAQLPRG